MGRSTDPKKAALWRTRFQRYPGTGLSVARFCATEGVSEARRANRRHRTRR